MLQCVEQILKNGQGADQILDSLHQAVPASSQLGSFLTELSKQLFSNLQPGQVFRRVAVWACLWAGLVRASSVTRPEALHEALTCPSSLWPQGARLQVPGAAWRQPAQDIPHRHGLV